MMLSSSNSLAKAPAAGAVASMLSAAPLRQSVFELGGLPPLVALLQADSDTSYHAVQAVAQFAADERFRPMVAEQPGIGDSGDRFHTRGDAVCAARDWFAGTSAQRNDELALGRRDRRGRFCFAHPHSCVVEYRAAEWWTGIGAG